MYTIFEYNRQIHKTKQQKNNIQKLDLGHHISFSRNEIKV